MELKRRMNPDSIYLIAGFALDNKIRKIVGETFKNG